MATHGWLEYTVLKDLLEVLGFDNENDELAELFLQYAVKAAQEFDQAR